MHKYNVFKKYSYVDSTFYGFLSLFRGFRVTSDENCAELLDFLKVPSDTAL